MKFVRNMKIRWKLLSGFGVVILLTLIISAVSYMQLSRVDDSYSNILNGAVSRSVAMLNIKGNFAMCRRISAQAIIYCNDTETLNKIFDEYTALKNGSNDYFATYFTALDNDTTMSDEDKEARIILVGELQSLLINDYDSVVNNIFDRARQGDEKGALDELLKGAEIASIVSQKVDDVLASARNTRITVSEETSKSAWMSKFTILGLSIVAVLIAVVCAIFIAQMISKGIISVILAAKKISKGDLDVSVGSNDHDEIADLSNALLILKDTVSLLVHDIKNVSTAFEAGDIDAKIDETAFRGEFKSVATGINEALGGLLLDVLTAIETVVAFGDGNFDVEIKQLPGKKELLTTSFKSVQANLKKFNSDIQTVINGASVGKLDVTINSSEYKGDWNIMASGINGLLSAIVAPIREAIDVMNKLSEGNLHISVTGDYKGEFAVMKSALNTTLKMLGDYIDEISQILNDLAKDDLNQIVEREYVGEFSEIKSALNIIIDKLNHMVSDILASASNVATGATQMTQSSAILAQGASEQASSVEELSATISLIKETTDKNAKDAKDAEGLSKGSQEHAMQGNKYMDELLSAMDKIKESSNGISKIIKAIDDIAFQTNLLALNAAVEAARAGEHGKGFAVVAEEVRSLAGRSQASARETSALIEESISRVNDGTVIANQTAEALHTIVAGISDIANIITSISSSSSEQASAILQITEGTSQISKVVQTNSATSEETAAASQELSSQADVLKNLISAFKLKK